MTRLYLSPPHMSGRELDLVKTIFSSNWIAPVGPDLANFEKEFSQYVGSPFAVALSSGTAAIHLALIMAKVARGDEVLCSTLTFAATANPIAYLEAKPVFVDASPESWNMDPGLLAQELDELNRKGRRPRAVILVHLYGQSADIDPILQACNKYDVPLIEDAAEALGATYKGNSPGVFGRCGIYSFNGNKIITTSGGGMLVSKDQSLIEKARFLSTQARDPAPHYQHSTVGFNYRMSNVLAGIGRGQLQVIGERVARRRAIFEHYQKVLGGKTGITFMPEASYGRATRWLTCIQVDPVQCGVDREKIRTHLESLDIESRPVWKPLHLQPAFEGCRAVGGIVSEKLFEYGLCLPSGSQMSDDDVNRVCGHILELLKR